MVEAFEGAVVGGPQLSEDKVAVALEGLGITHVIYLADFMQGFLLEALLRRSPNISLISVCREGEAIPIAAGLWMAGKKALVMHQNSGLLETGDSIAGVGSDLRIPILMLIGYRGYRRSRSKALVDPPARYVEPFLRALEVPYEIIEADEDIQKIIALDRLAEETRRPTAALIAWEATW